jgi:hypothetical protein
MLIDFFKNELLKEWMLWATRFIWITRRQPQFLKRFTKS